MPGQRSDGNSRQPGQQVGIVQTERPLLAIGDQHARQDNGTQHGSRHVMQPLPHQRRETQIGKGKQAGANCKGDQRHAKNQQPGIHHASSPAVTDGLRRSSHTPTAMPLSAAAISPSLYGQAWHSSATAPATRAAAICGWLRNAGTTMPIKVASMAKSSPQPARFGTLWPNNAPTSELDTQDRYSANATPA